MLKEEEVLFAHESIRNIQDKLIESFRECLENKKNLIAHAPTGLGKTAASIGPALAFGLKNKLPVIYLTSRHTQHKIVVNTLKKIKEKYKIDFILADIIGKQWMCSEPNVEKLFSNEFNDYCKSQREHDRCEYCLNTKKKSGNLTFDAKVIFEKFLKEGINNCEDVIEICKKSALCAYEISILLAKKANVVISDYFYVFNPKIRDGFFSKTNKKLEDSIIIVDEGHNLPKRCRDSLSFKLSSFMLKNAKKEANKFNYELESLELIKDTLSELGDDLDDGEKLVRKEDFSGKIEKSFDYDDLTNDFLFIAEQVRERQKNSYIGSIGNFLEAWRGEDFGFIRVLSKNRKNELENVNLSYKCLDPSFVSKEVFNKAYCSIIMSGTLTPTFMYKDLLGVDDAVEKQFQSPFPKKNRLNLIVPETTTKFSRRGNEEYGKIANRLSRIVNAIKGNSAVFFPSYNLMNDIYQQLDLNKNFFMEHPKLSKKDKESLIERFKESKNGVLLGVSSGSLGEGIDIPGDCLKGVVIVGMPFPKPDLETKELINYFQNKYGKGKEYGYLLPAFTKCLQNAGRCIRSEKDKGVIVFLDERFVWPSYLRCFPPDWEIKVTKNFEDEIRRFFIQ